MTGFEPRTSGSDRSTNQDATLPPMIDNYFPYNFYRTFLKIFTPTCNISIYIYGSYIYDLHIYGLYIYDSLIFVYKILPIIVTIR